MKKLFIILLLFYFNISNAQNLVKGFILNQTDSLGITGVSITAMPGNYTVQSNSAGAYQFNLPKGKYQFSLSHLGYVKLAAHLEVDAAVSFNFYLKPAVNELKEVLVHTGYQDLPKERSTGSFVSINTAKFNEQFNPNVLSRLEAVANGISVNNRTAAAQGKLMVRGLSTISGPAEPLVILDNFPYQGDLNNINPNDVESITILKDAAASSIWGSRAGNGVIVITSKKARANQALSIDFNGNFTITQKNDLFSVSEMSISDYIGVEQFLYNKGYYNAKITANAKPVLSPVVELLLANTKGTLTNGALQEGLLALAQGNIKQDLLNRNYQNAVNRQFALSLRAGGRQVDWSFSAGYDANTSSLAAQSSRLNLNSFNTVRIKPWLSLDIGLRLTRSISGGGKAGYSDMASSGVIYPYLSLADANGTALPIAKTYSLSFLNGLNYNILADWKYYPLTDYLNNDIKQSNNDLLSNFGLNIELFKGFKVSVKYQYEYQQSNARSMFGAGSFMARNAVNSFTQISSNGDVVYKVPRGGILDESESTLKSHNLRSGLAYNKKWAWHDLNIIAGAELNENKINYSGSRLYGYNDENTSFSFADLSTAYPSFVTGSLTFIDKGPTDTQLKLNRFVSFYTNAAYTFKQRYTLSASARKDASNLFGLSTNDKWKPLWSVGASWDIAAEPFFKPGWVQDLKLRGSYGFSGNVDLSKTAITTLVNSVISPYTGTVTARFGQYANPALRWEQVATLNIGVDFSALNNRLSGSIEVFRKRATDLYGPSQADYTAVPTNALIKNVASIQAQGLDLLLRSKNINGRFGWITDLNLSLYRDKILDYYLANLNGATYVTNGNSIAPLNGYPVYAMFSYKWAGLDAAGNPQGYLKDVVSADYGSITGSGTRINDLVYSGPVFPTVYGNLGNTFSYKNLSLTLRLNYKFGYYFRRSSIDYGRLYSQGVSHADYALRWQKPGDENNTNVPAMIYPAVASRDLLALYNETLVERGDNIRLAYVSVAYQLNKENFKKMPLKSVQLQANAANLGIIWRANRKGLDPDYTAETVLPSKFFSIGLRGSF